MPGAAATGALHVPTARASASTNSVLFHIGTTASAAPEARPVTRQKAENVDEERSKRNSTNARCRSCGSDDRTRVSRDVSVAGATFQVIVACATCGHAFAALSRN